MRESNLSYGSWRIQGTPFNKMLHCGSRYNTWVQHAIQYLPQEILGQFVNTLAIFSTAQCDGLRIARAICEEREIILLSERVLPKKGVRREDHPDVRYFVFVILHEIAHAFRNHLSPLYDYLSQEEESAQEKEADDLAFSWFNEHIRTSENPNLHPLTHEEVEKARQKNQKVMNQLYEAI